MLCLDPNLFESVQMRLEFQCSSQDGSRTICPAPTTPSLLTSEAATGEVVLKQRRQLVVDIPPNCRLADEIRDMFGTQEFALEVEAGALLTTTNRISRKVLTSQIIDFQMSVGFNVGDFLSSASRASVEFDLT